MKIFLLSLLLVIIIGARAFPQQYFIRGRVYDKSSSSAISYTNIRVNDLTSGTAANKDGEFELKLAKGKYLLIASCIGYISDTISVELNRNLSKINFYLTPTNINLPEITVMPGENPAIRIIKNAIERKQLRNSKLFSYEFEAYTKGILKTQKDISARDNSVDLGVGADSSALKISGIIENESRGHYRKPDYYKDEIIARRQTANFPSSVNILTGGRIARSFYENTINFMGKDLPGPLADNALNYYDYYIRNTLAIDNNIVFRIFMSPKDKNDPGFTGDIYITDGSFDLLKVDLHINRAANTGGIFDSLTLFQQFAMFKDSIYMPVDYRIFATANVLNLAKFGFELNTILYDYKINTLNNDSMFTKAVLTVLPNADNKDSSYWGNAITIPNTKDEQAAYKRIDSLESLPVTFWDRFSFLSGRAPITDNFAVSAPLGMYHFNRVEGHAIDFGLFVDDALENRLNASFMSTYGFSDKKYKPVLNASYLLGDYRTYKISLSAYNKLAEVFGSSDNYNDLISTLLALLSKYEFRDYYYTKGFSLNASGDVFPVLSFNAGYTNHTDNNAFKNTNFSFFGKDKQFADNPVIYETRINELSAGFNFDFRDYIEDGMFRRRISPGSSYVTFGGNVIYSDKSLLNSSLYYTIYNMNIYGHINTFNSAHMNFKIFGMYTDGTLPYQSLYSLPGNINSTGQDFSFRTLNVNEVLGSRVLTLNIEHYFGDQLFRFSGIPGLKDSELQLIGFFNAAYSDVNNKSKQISPYPLMELTHPFYEIGFGIGHVLFPLRLDFAWRLNYMGENNFRIGINTLLIQ